MDAVLAVRFGPFLGGKRGQDVGGGHSWLWGLCLCQEVGEQITLACWRGPCAQGDLPSIGKSCTYNPEGAAGIGMRF